MVDDGFGKPSTRRLPYNDFGIILFQDVVAGPGQQTVETASYGANRLGFDVGEFVHVNRDHADEEYVQVLAADQENQTFTAVFTKSHSTGATVRPTVWPTADPQRGRQHGVRYPGGRQPGPGQRSHRGDSDVNRYETFLSPSRIACFRTVWYPTPCLSAIS